MPLHSCSICLEKDSKFIFCSTCTDKLKGSGKGKKGKEKEKEKERANVKVKCEKGHGEKDFGPLQPQVFNMLKQVKFKCHFCNCKKPPPLPKVEKPERELETEGIHIPTLFATDIEVTTNFPLTPGKKQTLE